MIRLKLALIGLGLVTLVLSTGQAQTVNYSYDDAGRLTRVDYGGDQAISYTYDLAGNLLRREVTSELGFTSVSAASFAAGEPLTAEMIASGFGVGLASDVVIAKVLPLPTDLLGTKVEITDSQGTTRAASLFFVSPNQINYLIPPGTSLGTAQVKVTSGAGGTITGAMQIARVAPSLFTANSQGTGVAAAAFLRVGEDNTRTQALVFDPRTGGAVPIDLGSEGDQVFLLLFGTGFRGFTQAVTATVSGESVRVLGAVPQGEFVGLDQVNIGPLPRSLAGGGDVNIVLTADGEQANTVTVNIR